MWLPSGVRRAQADAEHGQITLVSPKWGRRRPGVRAGSSRTAVRYASCC
jgi:hypothetical protein